MRTIDCLRELARHRSDEVVIASMTSAVLWPTLSDHPRDLIYVPSTMGGAPSLGLGLALARPHLRVVALNRRRVDADEPGSLVTIGEQAPPNLVLIVFDNGIYAVTGGQAAPGGGKVDFPEIAWACGWRTVYTFRDAAAWAEAVPEA